jgi:uncharacterized protein (TIGR02145 family)
LDISSEALPKYQWACNGDEGNVETYGRLYTWFAITDNRNVCPTGWHVPSDAEWNTLTNFLGGESVAGGKLKETGTTHWIAPNLGATNEVGFTALPGGYRYREGIFYNFNEYGFWWSSSECSNVSASSWHIGYGGQYTSIIVRDGNSWNTGFSVRCLRDE